MTTENQTSESVVTVVNIGSVREESLEDCQTSPSADFVGKVIGDNLKKIHYLSSDSIASPGEFPAPKTSLLYQSAWHAFGEHYAFRISPQLLWYTICHEVSILIGRYPEKYRHLFSDSEEKKTIRVRDNSLVYGSTENDWAASISLVRQPLRDLISEDVLDLFLPSFSGMTEADEVAILVCFMDTISSYYKFEWATMCGIPRIVVEGTEEDWALFESHVDQLAELFRGDELDPYFASLKQIVGKIYQTVASDEYDEYFWRSIFKVDEMSGGPYMTGWLANLSAYSPTDDGVELRSIRDWESSYPSGTEDFPAHISQVALNWDYYGTDIPMMFVSGILGVDAGTELTPRLGFGVLELKESAETD